MAIKTATFWLCNMTSAQKRLLGDVSDRLGEAHRAMVCEWLRLAMADMAYGENAGKQAGRLVFEQTPYSNDIVNNYAHADAYSRFKAQWKGVKRGEKTSVAFPGAAPFLFFAAPAQVRVEDRGGEWWLVRPRIYGGLTRADRVQNDELEWHLDPVDSRRGGWCGRTAASRR